MIRLISPPDPTYPLTKKNSLVNQVKFLQLVHTLATVQPSNIQILQKGRGINPGNSTSFTQLFIVHVCSPVTKLANTYLSEHQLVHHYFLEFFWQISTGSYCYLATVLSRASAHPPTNAHRSILTVLWLVHLKIHKWWEFWKLKPKQYVVNIQQNACFKGVNCLVTNSLTTTS